MKEKSLINCMEEIKIKLVWRFKTLGMKWIMNLIRNSRQLKIKLNGEQSEK